MIGQWLTSSGLKVYQPKIWQRRANLYGANIRATTIDYPFLATNFTYDIHGRMIGGKGFLFDILHLLESDLNFTTFLSLTVDGKFGGETNNGTWNGMVGMLLRDETDVVVASLTQTSKRYQVIDYTIPIFPNIQATLISRRSSRAVTNLTLYEKRFSFMTWVLISIVMLVMTIGFYIVNESGIDKFHSASDSEPFGPLQSVGLTAMTLMQLSYNISIKSTSARVLFISCTIFAYIMFTFFACDLIAGMTTGSKEVPIKSFQDVLDMGYQVNMCK